MDRRGVRQEIITRLFGQVLVRVLSLGLALARAAFGLLVHSSHALVFGGLVLGLGPVFVGLGPVFGLLGLGGLGGLGVGLDLDLAPLFALWPRSFSQQN